MGTKVKKLFVIEAEFSVIYVCNTHLHPAARRYLFEP
jgi:hypothetical protein